MDLADLITIGLRKLREDKIKQKDRRAQAIEDKVKPIPRERVSQLRRNVPRLVGPLSPDTIRGLAHLLRVSPVVVAHAMLHTIGVVSTEDVNGDQMIIVNGHNRTTEQVQALVHAAEEAIRRTEQGFEESEQPDAG